MRKMKKSLWIAVTVIALVLLSVTFAFAAEGECTHPNGYNDWLNGCTVFICDDCGLSQCDHSNRDYYVVTKEGQYDICRNCGEIVHVYCEHSEYETPRDDYWDDDLYEVYCGYECCDCGNYYKMGTKHQLGEYVKDELLFPCVLCDYKVWMNQLEDRGNYILDNSNGTYSGEWITYDYNNGTVKGEGVWTFDKNGVITAKGQGEINLGHIFRDLIVETDKSKVCKYCVQAGYSQDDETGKMIISEHEVMHPDNILTEKLYKVVLGEGIKSMCTMSTDTAYETLIEELVLPDSFTGDWCYYYYGTGDLCMPNATIKLPAGIKLPDATVGTVYIDKIITDKNSPYYYMDEDGNIFSKDKTVLYKYQGNGKSYTVPSTVKEIADLAFYMTEVEEVILPVGINKIGSEAFANCLSLENINLPYGLATIGYGAFEASGIVKITLPGSVKEIGKNVFNNCFWLEEVSLPDSLSEIPERTFYMCVSLKEVNIPASLKEIGVMAFSDCYDLKSAIVIPDTVEKIGDYAFEGCLSITDFTVSSKDIELAETGVGIKVPYYSFIKDIFTSENYADLWYSYIGKNEEYDKDKYNNRIAAAECDNNKYSKEIAYAEQKAYNEFLDVGYTACENLTIYCHEGSTAEAYAIENGIKYVAEVCEHSFGEWVADAEKGIKYKTCSKCGKTYEEEHTADDDNIGIEGNEGENKFTVKLIENPESTEYIYIRGLLEGNIIALYDINLLDENGNKVQPDGMVKVSLPLGEDVKYFTVLRINDNGTLTDMKAVREGDSVVFETDHFSYYVILGGETESDTGDNIKCECLCHRNPLLEIIIRIFKLLAKFLGKPFSFPCDC